MEHPSLIVVALGGNAISRPDEEGNVDQQFANSRATAKALADLIEQGHQLVITHGNGPQIGTFPPRTEAAAGAIYPLPMEVAVAHVQGGMGFMIAQALTNELNARGFDRMATAIVTTVRVDADDPAFRNPPQPTGASIEWRRPSSPRSASMPTPRRFATRPNRSGAPYPKRTPSGSLAAK